ncbi:MAG: C13 family peptidase, partial [Gemmatimonadaceae bacterium]
MVIRAGRKWLHLLGGIAVFFFSGGAPRASAQDASRTWLLIISGASGEPRFATEFASLGAAFRDAATQRFGIADSMAIWLAEDPSRDVKRIAGKSTRGLIDTTLGRVAAASHATDRVFILLLGHGSSQGGVSRFNVPGPDLTDADFRMLLDRFATQTVVFVNATSASGEFVKTLRGKNRIVLAATKSGAEANEAIFGRYFVRAYTAEGADVDKDGRVSLLEAFQFAHREVQRDYEQGNRLLTEHAVLDDDGDGQGRGDPGPNGPDGI